jgi:hypothetical protein
MHLPIANAQPAGATIATTREQAPKAPERVKYSRSGNSHIQVRKNGLMQKSQSQRDPGKDADYVTVKYETLFPSKNFDAQRRNQEHRKSADYNRSFN